MKMFFFRRYEAKLRTIIFFNNLEKKKVFRIKVFFSKLQRVKKDGNCKSSNDIVLFLLGCTFHLKNFFYAIVNLVPYPDS